MLNKLLLEGLVVVSFLLVESGRDNWWPIRGTDSPTNEFRTFSSQCLPAGITTAVGPRTADQSNSKQAEL